jgi:two-component system sensor histidine kinase CpxA
MEKISLVANEELLRRAIENVLRNAIRYTPVDTEVEVSLTQEKFIGTAYAVIRVRDHGEGVPEKALKELFRPFYRIADARDRQSGGAGLGLAIVEKAIKAHKGEVSASNTIDGGLLVEIRLPI